MQTFTVEDEVSEDQLRNLTNVESSITLLFEQWGDFSGYQYSYSERDSFYKQWWLSNSEVIILITYTSVDDDQLEIDAVDEMVGSLR